jgi:hypothetical protein
MYPETALDVQRALIGHAFYDAAEARRGTRGSEITSIAGTGLWIPLVETDGPTSDARLDAGDEESPLTVGRLEAPDVVELLAVQGLGRIAELTAHRHGHELAVTAHAASDELALERLADGLRSSWPQPSVILEAAGQEPGPWEAGTQRTTASGHVVGRPSTAPHARGIVLWTRGGFQVEIIGARGVQPRLWSADLRDAVARYTPGSTVKEMLAGWQPLTIAVTDPAATSAKQRLA